MKEQYDEIPDREKEQRGYARKLYRLLYELVAEMDKKIARSQERVDKENQPRPIKPVDQLRLDSLKQQAKGPAPPYMISDLMLCSYSLIK